MLRTWRGLMPQESSSSLMEVNMTSSASSRAACIEICGGLACTAAHPTRPPAQPTTGPKPWKSGPALRRLPLKFAVLWPALLRAHHMPLCPAETTQTSAG